MAGLRHRKTVKPAEIDQESIPFLKQKKVSKKEKHDNKTTAFKSKVSTLHGAGGISKSSRRRQNRKEKQSLQGNLGDLLSTLPEVQELTLDSSFVGKQKMVNPNSGSKASTKVTNQEIDRFENILKNDSFKKNPFATLQKHIQSTITRKPEFEKRNEKKAKMDLSK